MHRNFNFGCETILYFVCTGVISDFNEFGDVNAISSSNKKHDC